VREFVSGGVCVCVCVCVLVRQGFSGVGGMGGRQGPHLGHLGPERGEYPLRRTEQPPWCLCGGRGGGVQTERQ